MSFVCHFYIIRISSVCDSYILVCQLYVTHMTSVCHSYVLECHSYVTRMYSYVICMSLVCHSYVTRMYSYAIPMSLVCGFTMNSLNSDRGKLLLGISSLKYSHIKWTRSVSTIFVFVIYLQALGSYFLVRK